MKPDCPILQVLDAARWAPSGDNAQAWRFEYRDAHHAIIHAFDTRETVVYDMDGRPSQIALGALLETAHIAAAELGYQVEEQWPESPDTAQALRLGLRLHPDAALSPSPLYTSIRQRTVQRRPLQTRPLTADEKHALQSAAGQDWQLVWLEGHQRKTVARLLWRNALIRLTMPEAYPVHRDIIEWGTQFSEDRIPDQAIGMDPLGLRLMRWALASWQRVRFLNRYLAGTWLPRLQLDWLPALKCAAHFALLAKHPSQGLIDHVNAGRALQRFWLTADQLGLQVQPEMTPLIFSWYVRSGRPASQDVTIGVRMQQLQQQLQTLLGEDPLARAAYFGRIGAGPRAKARSLRRPLSALMLAGAPNEPSSAH